MSINKIGPPFQMKAEQKTALAAEAAVSATATRAP
jgi:hypothetical protein